MTRVEPRYNEPVTNEVIGFIVTSVTAQHMKKNLVIGNKFPQLPWPFVISSFHCICQSARFISGTKNKN